MCVQGFSNCSVCIVRSKYHFSITKVNSCVDWNDENDEFEVLGMMRFEDGKEQLHWAHNLLKRATCTMDLKHNVEAI